MRSRVERAMDDDDGLPGLDEVDVLQQIYGEELDVRRRRSVSGNEQIVIERRVRPMNASGCQSLVSVIVSIEITSPDPTDVSPPAPLVRLREPRGISETTLAHLHTSIDAFILAHRDQPMLYDLMQLVEETLVCKQQLPASPCSICQRAFARDCQSELIATDCDHFFHRRCFIRYRNHERFENQRELSLLPRDMGESVLDTSLRCPVCRCPVKNANSITSDEENDQDDDDQSDDDDEQGTAIGKWRELQRAFTDVYEKQKTQGGLIDLDVERQRNLVTEDTVVTLPSEMPSISAVTKNVDSLHVTAPSQRVAHARKQRANRDKVTPRRFDPDRDPRTINRYGNNSRREWRPRREDRDCQHPSPECGSVDESRASS